MSAEQSAALTHYAEQAAQAAVPIQWIVCALFERPGGDLGELLTVIEATARPEAEPLVEAADGKRVMHAEIFPADRLLAMPVDIRPRYRKHFEYLQMWRRAQQRGVQIAALRPWFDYDPVFLHEQVQSWLHPGVRWTGD